MSIKQHVFGDSVVYVEGGQRLNAIVLQSTVHLLNDEEEEHLVLSVPDPSQAAPTMSGNQVQQAMKPRYGVRPLAKTKPVNDEGGTQGTGWADREDAEADSDVLKDGPLLQDLVHEINASHPITAQGLELKEDEKFTAAAKHLGIEVTPYSKDDVHSQIVKELQHQGIKTPESPKPFQATEPIASPAIHSDDEFGEEGKSQEQITKENEAMRDPSKAAEAFDQNDLNNMPQATHDAVERGELDPVALNNDPENHPEFGKEAFAEPGEQERSNEEARQEEHHD